MNRQKLAVIYFLFALFIATPVFASESNGTIDSSYKYVWGENLGWINLKPDNGGVTITDSAVTGYAWSSVGGWINFSPTNGGVTNNTSGVLGGYAWSSQKGWLNLSGITINSGGEIIGSAGTLGSTAGRVNFSCDNCDARTDWRPLSARATQGGGGVGIRPPAPSPEPIIPEVIETYNEDLTINPDQSGKYTQDVEAGQVVLEAPVASVSSQTTFTIIEEPLAPNNKYLILPKAQLINSVFYNITAKDQSGQTVDSLSSPVTITLPVPPDILDASDLGVYWLDENADSWVLVPGAVFDFYADKVSFQVNYPAKFAIFKTLDKSDVLPVIPPKASVVDVIKDFIKDLISPPSKNDGQLDINFEINDTTIDDISELKFQVIFENFKESPVPVDITYFILDATGNKVFIGADNTIVVDRMVLNEQIKDLTLVPGKYKLVVDVFYNFGEKIGFNQDFNIMGFAEEKINYMWWRWVLFSLASGLSLFYLLMKLIKRRKMR